MATKPVLYSYFRSSASWRVRIVLALKSIDYEYKNVNLIKDGGQQNTEEYKTINPMGQVPAFVVGDVVLTQSLAIIDYLEDMYPEPSLVPKDPVKKAQARALAELIAAGTQPVQNLGVLLKVSDNAEGRADWGRFWIDKGFTVTVVSYPDICLSASTSVSPSFLSYCKARALAELISSGTQPMTNATVCKVLFKGDLDKRPEWSRQWIEKGFAAYEKMVQSTVGKYSVGDDITIADVCLVPQLFNAQRFKVDMSKFPTVQRIIDTCSEHPAFQAAVPNAQPDCPEDLKK